MTDDDRSIRPRYSDRCGARWHSLNATHCSTCHQTFESVDLFDWHLEGTVNRPRCKSRVAFARHGLVCVNDVWRWPTKSRKSQRETAARAA